MNFELLNACRTVVADAASAEHQARDKWVKAAKQLHKAGVVVEMLVKGTKESPNDQHDATVCATLRDMVIAGVSASKKSVKFSTPHPGADGADSMGKQAYPWTVAELLALTKDQLRSIDDDVLKNVRRTYMMLVDGPMMSRIRVHLDKIQNPDKVREPKGKKAETTAVTGEGFDLRTREGFLGAANGGLAGIAHWAGSAHRDSVENAARALIAALTAAV